MVSSIEASPNGSPFRRDLNWLSPGFGDSFEQFVRSRNPHLRPVDPGASLPQLFELPASAHTLFAVPICYELLSSHAMNAMYVTHFGGVSGRCSSPTS